MINILYIDDEPINLNIFEMAFKKDFRIFKSLSAKEGLNIFNNENIDLVVTDLRMPEMDGYEFIKEIKKVDPLMKCILLTAYYEPELAKNPEFVSLVHKYIIKPFKRDELKKIILDALAIE
jgi:response regulator RpfG family c-di-GMP phosphodiesterase